MSHQLSFPPKPLTHAPSPGRRGAAVLGLALSGAVAAVIAASPVRADPASPLVSVWKVTGYELQVVGDPPTQPFGASPKGALVVTPGGRWLQLITAADRKAASTDAERARLLQRMTGRGPGGFFHNL